MRRFAAPPSLPGGRGRQGDPGEELPTEKSEEPQATSTASPAGPIQADSLPLQSRPGAWD